MKVSAQRGFTLVELMVVVAIIGILSALALPSYNRYLVRAKRTQAQSFMHSVANKQEQYMLDRRSYAADLVALNMGVPSDISQHYTITTTPDMVATPPTYTVTATPIGGQAGGDAECGILYINNIGTKWTSTKAAPATGCW